MARAQKSQKKNTVSDAFLSTRRTSDFSRLWTHFRREAMPQNLVSPCLSDMNDTTKRRLANLYELRACQDRFQHRVERQLLEGSK